MDKIKYNLTSFWMAPVIAYSLTIEQYEGMLHDVKDCQAKLSDELSGFDMTTNEGHASLFSALSVSNQLRRYRHNVECRIKYHFEPVQDNTTTLDVYTTSMAHQREQARGRNGN